METVTVQPRGLSPRGWPNLSGERSLTPGIERARLDASESKSRARGSVRGAYPRALQR